jgi:4-amino-4-deoxy-L-arabinose transferase-like glycosyltransferase
MIPNEDTVVQELIHRVESGAWQGALLKLLFAAAVAGLAAVYLLVNFRGLESETAMDQAQVGRQIAAGAGYTTLYVRPLAIWQFRSHLDELPVGAPPDIYNFPLNPVLNAVVLRPIKRWWPMSRTDIIYVGDLAIAATGILLFLASTIVIFFLVRELFDPRIAWLTAGLMLVTDLLWKFSTSGLPQMLVFFLFGIALWLIHRAILAREDAQAGRMLALLAGTGFVFGLMTLAHPLTSWLFAGFLAFVFLWFQPRAFSGLLIFFVYAAVISPWLVRNYLVCGNPFGLAPFSMLEGTGSSEYAAMSTVTPDLSAFGAVRGKLRSGVMDQFEQLFAYLGHNIAGAAFFLSLLHIFKRRATGLLRWAVLAMWVSAVLGMAVFSPRGAVSHNQLHIIFLPLFIAYGTAFLLVLWGRMNLRFPKARTAFVTGVFLFSAIPMAVNLLGSPPGRVAWPPYVAPFINAVSNWMEPNEVICSDMPWATAWYGGRLSLLLPATIPQFITIHDYKYLGGPVNGLYLTPVSGNRPFLSQIAKGDYGAWASFIMRTADLSRFPLQYFTPLPIDNECVFYSNRDRWTPRE